MALATGLLDDDNRVTECVCISGGSPRAIVDAALGIRHAVPTPYSAADVNLYASNVRCVCARL